MIVRYSGMHWGFGAELCGLGSCYDINDLLYASEVFQVI